MTRRYSNSAQREMGSQTPALKTTRKRAGRTNRIQLWKLRNLLCTVNEKNTKAAEQEEATAISNRFVRCSMEVHRYYKIIFSTCLYIYIIP